MGFHPDTNIQSKNEDVNKDLLIKSLEEEIAFMKRNESNKERQLDELHEYYKEKTNKLIKKLEDEKYRYEALLHEYKVLSEKIERNEVGLKIIK